MYKATNELVNVFKQIESELCKTDFSAQLTEPYIIQWFGTQIDNTNFDYRRFKLFRYLTEVCHIKVIPLTSMSYWNIQFKNGSFKKYFKTAIVNNALAVILSHPKEHWLITDVLEDSTKLIYDITDNWTATNKDINEEYLFSRANTITCSSKFLLDRIPAEHKQKAMLLENGADLSVFPEKTDKFDKISAVYAGFLLDKLDLFDLNRTILLNPDIDFYIISNWFAKDKRKQAALVELQNKNIANLHIMAPMPYKDTLNFMSKCHIGFLPLDSFSDWAKGMFSLKIFDYLKCGLPTVYSGSDNYHNYDNIFCFNLDDHSFKDVVEQWDYNRDWQQILEQNSWENRFKQFVEFHNIDNLKLDVSPANPFPLKYNKTKFITEKSFISDFEQKSFEVNKGSNEYVYFKKVGTDIIFSTTTPTAPRIVWAKENDKFIFSIDFDPVILFEKHFHSEADIFSICPKQPIDKFKARIKREFCAKYINFIEDWQQVVIHKDGSFEVTPFNFVPYTIDLVDAYDNLHKLLVKYKIYIRDNISTFIPTITGGADTRALTGIYRNLSGLTNKYYLRDFKNDGKYQINEGKCDMFCAEQVATALGFTERVASWAHFSKDQFTLSGLFTENGHQATDDPEDTGLALNDPAFLYKFIKHADLSARTIRIFQDRLFLEIRQPKVRVLRALLLLLLAPDLIDLPMNSLSSVYQKYQGPYDFRTENADVIEIAKQIIETWGKEKCDNILNENYVFDSGQGKYIFKE